jgi:hypothetical protein
MGIKSNYPQFASFLTPDTITPFFRASINRWPNFGKRLSISPSSGRKWLLEASVASLAAVTAMLGN